MSTVIIMLVSWVVMSWSLLLLQNFENTRSGKDESFGVSSRRPLFRGSSR